MWVLRLQQLRTTALQPCIVQCTPSTPFLSQSRNARFVLWIGGRERVCFSQPAVVRRWVEGDGGGGAGALEVAVRHAGTDSWTDPPAGSQVRELSERSEARPRLARLHQRVQEALAGNISSADVRASSRPEREAGGWAGGPASGARRCRLLCPAASTWPFAAVHPAGCAFCQSFLTTSAKQARN